MVNKDDQVEESSIVDVAYDDGFGEYLGTETIEKLLAAQKFLDRIGLIFIIVYKDETIKYVNRAGCEILGYNDPNELINKNWFETFIPEENRDEIRDVFSKILSKNIDPVVSYENVIITKDGSRKHIAWNNSYTIDKNNNIVGTTSTGLDITDRVQLSNEIKTRNRKLNTILENLNEGFIMGSIDTGTIDFVNDCFCSMLGFTADEIIGKSPEHFLTNESKIIFQKNRKKRLKGKTPRYSLDWICKDKSIIKTDISPGILKDFEGKITASFAIVVDKTEIFELQKTQKKIILELERVFKAVPDGLLVIDNDFTIIDMNDSIVDMFGFNSKNDLLNKKCYNVLYHEHCNTAKCTLKQVKKKGAIITEVQKSRVDGIFIPCLLSASSIINQDGEFLGIVEHVKDITEIKEREEKLETLSFNLQERVKELRCLYEISNYHFDLTQPLSDYFNFVIERIPTGWLYPSITTARITYLKKNYQTKNFKETLWKLSVPLIDGKRKIGKIDVCLLKEVDSEEPFLSEEVDLLNSIAKNVSDFISLYKSQFALKELNKQLEDKVKMRTKALKQINEDLHQQIQETEIAKEAFEISNLKYQRLFDTSLDGLFFADIHSDFIQVNPAFLDMLGYTEEELLKLSHLDITPKKWHAMEAEIFATEILRKGHSRNYEKEYIRKDGTIFPAKVRLWLVEDETSNSKVLYGSIHDITKEKELEQKLLQEKEQLDVTLKSIGDGVIATDKDSKIILMNRVAEKLTGWSIEEAIGKQLTEVFRIINEFSRKEIRNPVEIALEKGSSVELENSTVLICKDGSERIIGDSAAPIRNKNGKIVGVVLVFRDMTQKSLMEREIQKTQSLEAIGVLAGGIAHDFNNILTAILVNLNLARSKHKIKDDVDKKLREAETAAQRAKNLTQQLLTFAKGGLPFREIVDIDKLVVETVNFSLSGSNIQCQFNHDKDLWNAVVDKVQIGQVINNLVRNAVDAMPKGGKITVNLENRKVTKKDELPLKVGNYIQISIRDEGHGIPLQIQDYVFEPYFTTKDHGTGLGLATSHSIVKKHEGIITFESSKEGTTFIVILPATKNKLPTIESEKESEELVKGTGKILVMDDEIVLLEVIGEMLGTLGYDVSLAMHGEEAIKLYKEALTNSEPYDLVILDITVPGGMGGEKTIKELKKIDPTVKAVVSSGYSEIPIMANYKDYGFIDVLRKPYTSQKLSEKISNLLEINR